MVEGSHRQISPAKFSAASGNDKKICFWCDNWIPAYPQLEHHASLPLSPSYKGLTVNNFITTQPQGTAGVSWNHQMVQSSSLVILNLIGVAVNKLWQWRNSLVFEHGNRPNGIPDSLSCAILQTANDISIAKSTITQVGLVKQKQECYIQRPTPCPKWIKLNTDSVVQAIGSTGAGCLCRDEDGQWRAGFITRKMQFLHRCIMGIIYWFKNGLGT
ncbi:hypothetical protein Ancab_031734 [Ancistrocladus abbreviatus]